MNVTEKPPDESNEEKCRQMEKKVNELLKESIFAWEKGQMKQALEKAKEAVIYLVGRPGEHGHCYVSELQYMANNLLTEALNTYQVIVKNKMFANSSRLKVNIANIYFKQKDYKKAIKYYRMALDQVPNFQKSKRHLRYPIKIMNNIGVAFIKCGEYDEAASTFEHCMEEKGDYNMALNLILTAYCLNDVEKMKDGFQRLLDLPALLDDEPKYADQQDFLLSQLIANDTLKQWERSHRHTAEKTIFVAARIISSAIAPTFSEGYEWCVEAIRQSLYSPLAMEIEMSKAVALLRQGDLETASQVRFTNQALRVFPPALLNLSMQNIDTGQAAVALGSGTIRYPTKFVAKKQYCLFHLQPVDVLSAPFCCVFIIAVYQILQQGPSKLEDAVQYCEQALSLDRYNASALVNRGNIFFVLGDLEKAAQYYKEALSNEVSAFHTENLGFTWHTTFTLI
ncbi:unnamed protein product, partial [Gongylonema pulchrum]|uniref:TPR_REGION domain-containing protein n=1 Tax=Gongylonema pulchrum TaxID=637853 RepID=A0A183E5S2_9BILA